MIGAASFVMRQQQQQGQGQEQAGAQQPQATPDVGAIMEDADSSGSDYEQPDGWRPALDRTRTGLHAMLSPKAGAGGAADEYNDVAIGMSTQRPLQPSGMSSTAARRSSAGTDAQRRQIRTLASSFVGMRSSLWEAPRKRRCPCVCRRHSSSRRHVSAESNAFGSCFGTLPPGYTMRQQVSIVLSGTPCGHAWDIFQTVLSLLACGLYVGATYGMLEPLWLEILITVLFTIDYLLRLYAADNRLLYPFTFHAVADLCTILPVYLEVAMDNDLPPFGFLRFVRVLRIMRILRAFKVVNALMSAVSRQLVSLILTITSIMILSAGLVHVVESELSTANVNMTFGDAVYFIIVTMSTVGYGDIKPTTDLGRWIVSFMIIVSLVLIPMQVNTLSTLLAQQSRFRNRVKVMRVPHALLVGHIHSKAFLFEFVQEFFHPDRMGPLDSDFKTRQLVIVSPDKPKDYVQRMMSNPVYENKLRYFQGSVMHDEDLYGAAADAADACFVLSNPDAKDREKEDKHTILRTLAVMNFNPTLRAYVHLLDVRHKPLIDQAQASEVVCVNLLKMQLIAQSCVSLGFTTLVHNLLRSITPTKTGAVAWLQEYKEGCNQELHSIPMPPDLLGHTFTDVAMAVYERFRGEAICWGVRHFPPDASAARVLLNPGTTYRCREGDKLYITTTSLHMSAEVATMGTARFLPVDSESRPSMTRVGSKRDMDGAACHVGVHQSTPFGPREARSTLQQLRSRVKERVDFKDHIIIAGDLADADVLLAALRTRVLHAMGMAKQVVLIHSGDLAELTFVPMYREVYIVKGHASHVHTLRKCNLSQAHCCVLLPSPATVEQVDGDVLDTNVIFSYLVVEKFLGEGVDSNAARKPYVVANVSSVSNMRVLDSSIRAKVKQDSSSVRASMRNDGRGVGARRQLTVAGFVDTPRAAQRRKQERAKDEADRRQLLAQQQLERMRINKQRRRENAEMFARGGDSGVNLPFFAGGQCFATNTLHTLLCQSFYDPDTFQFAKALLDPSVHNSMLLPYLVPKSLQGKTFGYLFRRLIRRNIVAVALYRAASPDHSGYVYSGPAHDSRLHEGDKVFVLERPGRQWSHTKRLPLSFRSNVGRSNRGLGAEVAAALAGVRDKGDEDSKTLPAVHGAGTGTGRPHNGRPGDATGGGDGGSGGGLSPEAGHRGRARSKDDRAKVLYGAGADMSDRHIEQALDAMGSGGSVGSAGVDACSLNSLDGALMGSANSVQSGVSLEPTGVSFALAPGVNSVGGGSTRLAPGVAHGSVASGMTNGVGDSVLQPQVFVLGPSQESARSDGGIHESGRDMQSRHATVSFAMTGGTMSGEGTPVAGAVGPSPLSSHRGTPPNGSR